MYSGGHLQTQGLYKKLDSPESRVCRRPPESPCTMIHFLEKRNYCKFQGGSVENLQIIPHRGAAKSGQNGREVPAVPAGGRLPVGRSQNRALMCLNKA